MHLRCSGHSGPQVWEKAAIFILFFHYYIIFKFLISAIFLIA